MTITLTNSASTADVVLVSGPGRPSDTYAQGPLGDGEEFSAQQSVTVSRPIRAASAVVRGRGCNTGSYPFSALREFSTYAAARVWAAAHAKAVCLQALTHLEVADGASVQKLVGAMSSASCRVRGVSVVCSYVFEYGEAS
jgi:hypothetical protein